MKVKNITTKEQFDELYEEWALTIEGLIADEQTLQAFENWLKSHNVDTTNAIFCVIQGKCMNDTYGLTGKNAYHDDLTIVSVLGIDETPITIARMGIGGRWFTNIVDNNNKNEMKYKK